MLCAWIVPDVWSSVLLQHMLDLPLPIRYQIWIQHMFNLLQHMFQLSTQLLLSLAPRSSTCTTESVLLSHISHANALLQQHMPPSPPVRPSFLWVIRRLISTLKFGRDQNCIRSRLIVTENALLCWLAYGRDVGYIRSWPNFTGMLYFAGRLLCWLKVDI